MLGKPSWRSTRTQVAALIVALVAVVWGEVLKDAVEQAERYAAAKAAIEANKAVDSLLKASQNLAFDHCRTNVILHLPAPIGDEHRVFLAARRQAADDNLAAAIRHLDGTPAPALALLGDAHQQIRRLRDLIDPATERPRDDRPTDLADRWMAATSGMQDAIRDLATAVSLGAHGYSADFRSHSRVKLLAFDLHDALAVESSRIAADIAAPTAANTAIATEIMRRRGESAATWRALMREVSLTGDTALLQSATDIESRFFRELRPLQERVLAARLSGLDPPVTVEGYTRAAVPALESIAALTDVTARRTAAIAERDAADARVSMLAYGAVAALTLVLGTVAVATLSVRLLGPLRRMQSQLRALSRGDVEIALPPPQRADEMGEMQAAVAAFRNLLVERQHIADELIHQSELLTTLINAMPDFVCFKDGEGRWLVVNDYGRTLFGLGAVDYRGKTDRELSEAAAGCRQTLCGCVETDERAWSRRSPLRGEEVVTGADGKVYIFDVVKVPLFRADGSRKGLVVVGRDITERRRIEVALARLSRQNELILEAAGEGIIGMDAAGNTIFANPAAVRMTGWDVGDLLGRSHHQLVHHSHADGTPAPACDCPLSMILTDGQPRHVTDDVFWRKDGSSFPVEFSADAIVEQGAVRGAVIVFRDIGAQKRTAAEIEALLADLRRSNADLEQFAYAVSHDLQEPLRMVASYIEMLRRRYAGKLDRDADEFIDFAVDGSKRMSVMINALLEFARVGTRGAEPHPMEMSLPVTLALANLATAIEESGATVEVEEPLPRVVGDEAQLTSVIQNLVANAIKYCRPGTRPAVHIAARPDGAMWVVTVSDNGLGIPVGDRERVFGVFQRLGARPDVTGTGMGLAICKRIVERLGGGIWIEDSAQGGSRFAFRLPAA